MESPIRRLPIDAAYLEPQSINISKTKIKSSYTLLSFDGSNVRFCSESDESKKFVDC